MRVYGRKTAYVNTAIIIINVLCFLYLELQGSTENAGFMLAHGAMFAPLVVDHGQYYRLVTSVFMHFGVSHLMNNMLVLFVLGDNLERALGHVKYLIFYLLCGVGANLVSMTVNLMTGSLSVGAGASGAIFGVVGGLVYAVGVNRGRLEDLTSRQLGVMILLTLYHGFTSMNIDNAAHIGGLAAGILLGILLYRKPRRYMGYGI
ncbi:rhomboid family intramembrane serine protease [Clostridium sp. AF18-27]|nr:rhomboid family intramembrane serine protease [Enterocloster lavalensis]MBS5604396.1 rhomboid family intramembrane serine protease [Enterocloster asparagiformis]MCB6341549.1 rhomboid family intramembrane serine protease [Enterocloster lavalensis]PST32011.1 rhomboid family intramembrane serine protease [Enterocloster lavalensis]RHR56095.1 rhomboid family intramembrane serine protease [Clostridium sp. AF18-27]